MKSLTINKIAKIAIFSALSVILYQINFSLPFFPGFLKIHFSNLPIIIGGFALGPVPGVVIVLIRFLIKLPFSETAFVGEFGDLIIGTITVLASSLVYNYNKTKKGAVLGLLSGCVAWVISAVISNVFLLVPFYVRFYFAGNVNTFIGALSVIPGVNASNYMTRYVLLAVIPFNLLLSFMVSVITYIVYKRISDVLHRFK